MRRLRVDGQFESLSDLDALVARHRLPADGIYRDLGNHWGVMLTFIPGPTYRGVLPKTPEVAAWMAGHNWREG